MEANNGPVDFDRSWSVTQLRYCNHSSKESCTCFLNLLSFLVLLPCEILEQGEEEINHPRFTGMCGHSVHGQKFLHEFMDFIQLIASRASQERVLQGLDDGYNYQGFKDNGRVFQLDRAPFMDTKKMKQLPVWIEEEDNSYDHHHHIPSSLFFRKELLITRNHL